MDLARSIGALFSRCASWSCRFLKRPELSPAQRLGRRGEALASRHLRRNGYRVLYRNFRPRRGGEVDLVCRDVREKTLVFVEVKTRTRMDFGAPHEAVDKQKQELLERGARAWLRLLDDDSVRYRFDIVEVILAGGQPQISILKNAF